MTNIIIVSTLIGIVIGAIIFYYLSRSMFESRPKDRPAPRFSEKEAEALLKRRMYDILSRQPKRTVVTQIDGKDHFGYIEADYIVRRGKNKFVVMVKVGEEAADPNDPILRRKLIELDHAFSVDGVLLVDLQSEELHHIDFHFPVERGIDAFFKYLIVLVVIFGVLGIIWVLSTLKLI